MLLSSAWLRSRPSTRITFTDAIYGACAATSPAKNHPEMSKLQCRINPAFRCGGGTPTLVGRNVRANMRRPTVLDAAVGLSLVLHGWAGIDTIGTDRMREGWLTCVACGSHRAWPRVDAGS